ncbi:hypothetical protein A2454_00450 [Candidatus Peribacteria bacterium RIFOXYC2_FULL_55_14]|nr:MAG: hypothetical protein UY90_C0035G0006 [Candidatus Peregrinibacteria bacterium GW2011_GWA2_54_9]OGJ71543.1 MAG: hypothetical protein A2198_05055 [Candidatus Peribacteria bacterium RIFOXYA1_FULL_56_14]OGJ72936.1 MAG: hypothetical protein A2217_06565 [Candidatus Peribacteria bacterium RIFOXYA2_FULL_55_28]OGJ73925.1 MAG: hypothetical protein A2384_04835 [Candidatus Peribacteria bacterium RIFOXYB1_FULL_54_35]OGJ76102.1 MAG: hypothetical protein A2327_04305 [Candidatus Peribacteria bacterium R
MNIPDADPPEELCEKPRLAVLCEGGSICSNASHEASKGVVKGMVSTLSRDLRRRFHRVGVTTYERELVQSSEVTPERIEDFVRVLRRLLETRQHIIALVSTFHAPAYATAVSEAVPSENLQLDPPEGSRTHKSLILACASGTAEDNRTDAFSTFRDAVCLSSKPEMANRAGVVYQGRLFALPGLYRRGEPTTFESRFSSIARKQGEKWYFHERKPEQLPIGEEGEYHLDPSVQTFNLEDAAGQVVSSVEAARTGGLRGMVLRTSRGRDRQSRFKENEQVLGMLNAMAIPGILVGSQLQQSGGNGKHLHEPEAESPYSYISDGGAFTSTEARMLLSHWVSLFRDLHLDETREQAGFVSQMIEKHPFRN